MLGFLRSGREANTCEALKQTRYYRKIQYVKISKSSKNIHTLATHK